MIARVIKCCQKNVSWVKYISLIIEYSMFSSDNNDKIDRQDAYIKVKDKLLYVV